jgi:hypothetical protein
MADPNVRTCDERLVSDAVVRAMREGVASCGAALLLVPTMPEAVRAQKALADRARLTLGCDVSTPSTWARGSWEVWGDGRHIADGSVLTVLAHEVIREAPAELAGPVTELPGMVAVVARLVGRALPWLPLTPAGELDEERYRSSLWDHRPLTDFWHVGPGTQERLAELGLHTMGQIALSDPEPIYRTLGVDAEILIDHAWGIEPVRIEHIKAYRPQAHSLSMGQVLGKDYDFDGGLLLVKEMADQLALRLVAAGQLAHAATLAIGYRKGDHGDPSPSGIRVEPSRWGELTSSGTRSFLSHTSSSAVIRREVAKLYRQVCDPSRRVHRLTLSLADVRDEDAKDLQLGLFDDLENDEREHRQLKAVNAVRSKFGSNALLRAMDLLPEATARERNKQIGGHRSGE